MSVDYKNEVTADVAQIDAGVMSEEDYANENGRDLAAIRLQKKQHTMAIFEDAKEIALATGQDVAVILPFLVKKFPNPGAGLSAAGEPKTEPAPNDTKKPIPALAS